MNLIFEMTSENFKIYNAVIEANEDLKAKELELTKLFFELKRKIFNPTNSQAVANRLGGANISIKLPEDIDGEIAILTGLGGYERAVGIRAKGCISEKELSENWKLVPPNTGIAK